MLPDRRSVEDTSAEMAEKNLKAKPNPEGKALPIYAFLSSSLSSEWIRARTKLTIMATRPMPRRMRSMVKKVCISRGRFEGGVAKVVLRKGIAKGYCEREDAKGKIRRGIAKGTIQRGIAKGCCEGLLCFFFTKIANRRLFFLKKSSYLYRLFAAIKSLIIWKRPLTPGPLPPSAEPYA